MRFTQSFGNKENSVWIPVLVKFALLMIVVEGYGLHRDEFYFLACGRHLALGYVDQPPLTPWIAAFSDWLLGDSILAIRFLPALAGTAIVWLTIKMTKELGGGLFSQLVAGISILIAPIFLANGHMLSTAVFDRLFWVSGIYVLVLLFRRKEPKFWILFGIIAGIGLLNKISVGFLGFALILGLLFTKQRKHFSSSYLWVGGIIAIAIFLPYLIWQQVNDWPTVEFFRKYGEGKTYPVTPFEFLLQQIITMHPLTFPIWILGLITLFRKGQFIVLRPIGWIFVICLILFIKMKAKFYFLSPLYPVLLSVGAIQIESYFGKNKVLFKYLGVLLLLVGGLITAPEALPLLSQENYVKYSSYMQFGKQVKSERRELGSLPQHFADMHGWENMVRVVSEVYNEFSTGEQEKIIILTGNYGEAGAIDYYGKKYSLPKARSTHNNYYFWGYGEEAPDKIITLGIPEKYLNYFFHSSEVHSVIRCKYCMPDENNLPVYVNSGSKIEFAELWRKAKHYD